MSEHIFDPSGPYHPEKLIKKAHIGADSFFQLDLRTGVIIRSEEFPETVSYTHLTLPTT